MNAAINEVGNGYSQLTVLKYAGTSGKGAMWLCQCNCGNKITVTGVRLRGGYTRSCGCLRKGHCPANVKNEIGNRYGRLVVIRRDGSTDSNLAQWLCQCNCGNLVTVVGNNLRKGHTQSCGCLARETASKSAVRNFRLPSGIAAANALEGRYKYGAKSRDLAWSLTTEEFREITKQNCVYCGEPPSQVYHQKHYNGDYIYNGLDRVNSLEGYTPMNTVPCCGTCNSAKRDMASDRFLSWARRLAQHQGWTK